MQFNRVIGQETIKKRLIDGVSESRISHALLFAGSEGTGKLAMAIAYAQFVACPNRTENESCGTCPSCKKFNKLAHPDLHFVFPVVKTPKIKEPVSDNYILQWRELVTNNPYFNLNMWYKSIDVENAQGNIYVHESHEIIRKLNLKTFEAEYKVMIIWMAERMNMQCANKLLKMIEEPPPKTLFILISENDEQILPTIRSRTQLIKFNKIDNHSMAEAIAAMPQAAGMNVEGIVHLANGNFITAMDLLQPDEEKALYFEQFTVLMRSTYKREWAAIFEWAENLAGIGRERQKSFLTYCMRMMRENFVMNFHRDDLVFLNETEKKFSSNFSPFINERNIISFSEELEKAYRDIAQNGNPRVIFLDFSLKVVKLIRA